jgi:hypothetical protein
MILFYRRRGLSEGIKWQSENGEKSQKDKKRHGMAKKSRPAAA